MTSTDLARRFSTAFELAKELQKSQPAEVSQLMQAIACHLRSFDPMAFLGAADVLDPLQELVIPTSDGGRIELHAVDGVTSLYVFDASKRDACVPLPARQAEELRSGLARVR
jgi:hypothetical protein